MTDNTTTSEAFRNLQIDNRATGGAVESRNGRVESVATHRPAAYQHPGTSKADSSGRVVEVFSREKGRVIPVSEATDRDLIDYQGMKVSVRTLVSRGVLERNESGGLRFTTDGGKGAQAARQAQQAASQEQQQRPQAEAMAPQVEALVTEVATGADQHDVLTVINSLSKGEEPTADMLGKIASAMQIEPEQVGEKFSAIRASFEAQALKSVSSYGIDPEDIMSWGYAEAPELMQKAIRQHATQRSTAGYKTVAEQFIQALDRIDPDSVLYAELTPGWFAKRAANGRVLLVDPSGREHSYAALAKAGKVKVSKPR